MRTYEKAAAAARKVKPAPTHKTRRVGTSYRYECTKPKTCGYVADVNWLAPKSKVTVVTQGKVKAAHSIKP